ncbi:C45 family autoproteolytic acyltransferase/hydolase [Pseudoroseicyclus sp. CXY001]|uniref:C45 family autoproteolytic acyltransferase/hydolase n=1 Tax=Pseudoroseicyclus sp. CXY001 TaxID=3242492 RepID=UPI00358DCCF3
MSSYEPFPLIEISGDRRQRGHGYGEAARGRIRASIALYSEQIAGLGCDLSTLATLTDPFAQKITDFAPHLVEEMRYIAEGAGVSFAEILLVNARTEIVQLARRRGMAAEPDGCTGIAALPSATADGKLIQAQNWDWRAECAETSVVLRITGTDGPDILTFTEAGGMARSGLNAAGISITANYLECDRDYRSFGVPLALIRRRALEARHLSEALRIVATTPKSAANNMIVGSAEGFAVDFECAPDETFAIYPERGLIVHANHWQSPVALAKLRETGLESVPDSLYRDWRVKEALTPKIGAITLADTRSALGDRFGYPYSVCRPPIPGAKGNLSATVARVVMVPADGYLEVTPMPALNETAGTYRIEPELEPVRATGT